MNKEVGAVVDTGEAMKEEAAVDMAAEADSRKGLRFQISMLEPLMSCSLTISSSRSEIRTA